MNTVTRLITTFAPTHYTLSLNLQRRARTYSGTVAIEGTTFADNTLRLHAKDITIESAHIDGHAATWTQHENDEIELVCENTTAGEHVVTIHFSGEITDAMHGMYPCYYTQDGEKKELLATQFESHHAREVFPCVDEPETKATFDVTLSTETDVQVLGNMPVASQREENGQLVTSFERTPRMSSYLLAWVVGDLQKKTAATKDGVEVNVWATPVHAPESLDFALDTAVRTIEFFNEYFDTPYPLPKCDHVALPDFTSGAMENWGLITYREIALLADPKTSSISTKRYVATVITHELSHQWFGNLVTMKWWNNLWLNESFANLMEYIAVDALYPQWNIWLEHAANESVMALRRDSTPGVQSVQTDVHHPDEISTLFDGAIVYAKGGRLLRMLQHYIGTEAFQAGLKNYFKKYAYQNTEGDDLWHELATASGKDITSLMNTWISQPGYPVVAVSSDSLSQEQFFVGEHPPSTAVWPIPLGAASDAVPELFSELNVKAALPVGEKLNYGDSAHFVTHYSPAHTQALLKRVQKNTLEPIDRLQLLHEATILARGGRMTTADLLPILAAYAGETIDNIWDIMALTLSEFKKFVEQDKQAEQHLRKLSGRLATAQFERLGWQAKNGEPESDSQLRSTIAGMMVYSEQPEVLEAAHQLYQTGSLDTLDPELRALIIGVEVRHFGNLQLAKDLLQHYTATPSADLQLDIASGLTSTKDPVVVSYLLEQLKNSDVIRPQDVARWYAYLIRSRDGRSHAWQWMTDNWPWLEKTFSGDKSFDDYPRYSAMGLVTRQQLEAYEAFFAPLSTHPALSRVIAMGTAEIKARVELIERDGEAVKRALAEL